jgi:hypothetical protein
VLRTSSSIEEEPYKTHGLDGAGDGSDEHPDPPTVQPPNCLTAHPPYLFSNVHVYVDPPKFAETVSVVPTIE